MLFCLLNIRDPLICLLVSLFDVMCSIYWFFFLKQKTAYEMRISDWSSDACSSDLRPGRKWSWRTLNDPSHRDPDFACDRCCPDAARGPCPAVKPAPDRTSVV